MQVKPFPSGNGKARGFTLIELIITIVIVGILTSVALPSFLDAIRKGRRSEAFAAITAVQQAQERWRANNAGYATNLTAAPPTGLGLPAATATYYNIALANVAATGYDVTAIAISGTSQANDSQCAKMGVRVTGGNLTYAGTGGSGTLDYQATNKCWAR